MRALTLLVLLVVVGCADVRRPDWNLRFASPELRARVFAIDVRILRGGCGVERVAFSGTLVPGAESPSPSRLSAGTYGFEARGANTLCRYVAAGCVDVELPSAAPIDIMLESVAESDRCSSDRCVEGLCEGIDFGDGRVPPPPRAIRPAQGARGPSPILFEWASSPGADRYELELGPCVGAIADCATGEITSTPMLTRTELLDRGRWLWRLRACNDAGCSSPSRARIITVGAEHDVDDDGRADLIVGAPLEANGGIANAGAAYAYTNVSAMMSMRLASVPENGARVGTAITTADLDGDGVLETYVGAPFADGSGSDEGMVLRFPGARPIESDAARPDSAFGSALAHCDVDADGFDELIVGAPGRDDGRGAVEVFFGPDRERLWTLSAVVQPASAFGAQVDCGDFDADGTLEVVVSAPGQNVGSSNGSGSVYVFRGEGTADVVLTQPEREADASFGATLHVLGDVDGDGIDDLLVGAPGASGGGRAYLYRGRLGTLPTTAEVISNPGGLMDSFAAAVSGGGDTDGDGARDFAIGAPGGRTVYLYAGSSAPSELVLTPLTTLTSVAERYGSAVTLVDVSLDFLADLAVGSPMVGEVILHRGVVNATPDTVLTGPPGADFGARLGR